MSALLQQRTRQQNSRFAHFSLFSFGLFIVILVHYNHSPPSTSPPPTATKSYYLAVIGIQTGFDNPAVVSPLKRPTYNYTGRRHAIRNTWLQSTGTHQNDPSPLLVRFVIGHSSDATQEQDVGREEASHHDFIRLPLVEDYRSLTNKTMTFFQTILEHYSFQYVIKVDDDVYLKLHTVPTAISQWKSHQYDYIGCMKRGQIFKNPLLRWYEPQHAILGDREYFSHAWGSLYVLSYNAIARLMKLHPETLRYFANEDVTVGSWMLVLPVLHYDDRRLCATSCDRDLNAIAVWDYPQCAGLCDPIHSMARLHSHPSCSLSMAKAWGRGPRAPSSLPMVPPLIRFDLSTQ